MLLLRQEIKVIEALEFKSFGIIDYKKSLLAMQSHIKNEEFNNEIWFLQHHPVYTLGTAADKLHILNSGNIPVIQTDRGGEVTYHGPGQLVIYFLLDIKLLNIGPKSLVKIIENFIQKTLTEVSIESHLVKGAPGVFVQNKKIASIGLRISNNKTYHGISINVDMDTEPFDNINPCGYADLKVTQIKEFSDTIKISNIEAIAKKNLNNLFKMNYEKA
jgi:lipoyl(octanoyl) transferase